MGKVRQSYIKDIGNEIFERYPEKVTTNFELNKLLIEEISTPSTHRLRNRIAGYLVTLKKNENKIITSPDKGRKPIFKNKRNKRNMGRRKRKKKRR